MYLLVSICSVLDCLETPYQMVHRQVSMCQNLFQRSVCPLLSYFIGPNFSIIKMKILCMKQKSKTAVDGIFKTQLKQNFYV